MHARANDGLPTHCYTQNNVLEIPKRASDEEDDKMIKEIGRKLITIAEAGDDYIGEERKAFIVGKLQELERQYA